MTTILTLREPLSKAVEKTEDTWPICFELIQEHKQVGRWETSSWQVSNIKLQSKNAACDEAQTSDETESIWCDFVLEIYRDERTDYRFNLSSREPKLFFAFEQESTDTTPTPIAVTASQSIVGDFMDSDYLVLSVDMPLPIQAWLEAFIGRHGELLEVRRKKRKGAGRACGN